MARATIGSNSSSGMYDHDMMMDDDIGMAEYKRVYGTPASTAAASAHSSIGHVLPLGEPVTMLSPSIIPPLPPSLSHDDHIIIDAPTIAAYMVCTEYLRVKWPRLFAIHFAHSGLIPLLSFITPSPLSSSNSSSATSASPSAMTPLNEGAEGVPIVPTSLSISPMHIMNGVVDWLSQLPLTDPYMRNDDTHTSPFAYGSSYAPRNNSSSNSEKEKYVPAAPFTLDASNYGQEHKTIVISLLAITRQLAMITNGNGNTVLRASLLYGTLRRIWDLLLWYDQKPSPALYWLLAELTPVTLSNYNVTTASASLSPTPPSTASAPNNGETKGASSAPVTPPMIARTGDTSLSPIPSISLTNTPGSTGTSNSMGATNASNESASPFVVSTPPSLAAMHSVDVAPHVITTIHHMCSVIISDINIPETHISRAVERLCQWACSPVIRVWLRQLWWLIRRARRYDLLIAQAKLCVPHLIAQLHCRPLATHGQQWTPPPYYSHSAAPLPPIGYGWSERRREEALILLEDIFVGYQNEPELFQDMIPSLCGVLDTLLTEVKDVQAKLKEREREDEIDRIARATAVPTRRAFLSTPSIPVLSSSSGSSSVVMVSTAKQERMDRDVAFRSRVITMIQSLLYIHYGASSLIQPLLDRLSVDEQDFSGALLSRIRERVEASRWVLPNRDAPSWIEGAWNSTVFGPISFKMEEEVVVRRIRGVSGADPTVGGSLDGLLWRAKDKNECHFQGTWKAASLQQPASFQAKVDPTMSDFDGSWSYGEDLPREISAIKVTQSTGFTFNDSLLHRRAPAVTHDGDGNAEVKALPTPTPTPTPTSVTDTKPLPSSYRAIPPSSHERDNTSRWNEFESDRVSVRSHALANGRERVMGGHWVEIEMSASSGATSMTERHAACAAAIGSDIFCFGGQSTSLTGTFNKLEMDGGVAWHQLYSVSGPVPNQNLSYTAMAAARQCVWTFGGQSIAGSIYGEFWRYDPRSTLWYHITNPCGDDTRYGRRVEEESLPWPGPRSFHAMAATADERHIYMFGGRTTETTYLTISPEVVSNELWCYHIDDGSWEVIVARSHHVPCRRWGHTMVTAHGALWVFGGQNAAGTYLDDLWRFDYTECTWTQMESAHYNTRPVARTQHASCVVDNFIYIHGGMIREDGKQERADDLWKFDIELGEWHQSLPMGGRPPARSNHVMCSVPRRADGHTFTVIIILGGMASNSRARKDIWRFTAAFPHETIDSPTNPLVDVMTFSGMKAWLDCNGAHWMAFQNQAAYTLECWVLPAEKKFQSILSKWNRARNTGEYSFHLNDEGKLTGLRLQPGVTDPSLTTIYANVIPPNVFTHVALTYGGDQTMRLWINGVEKAWHGRMNPHFETDVRLTIGSTTPIDGANANPFNGTICEVRVWNLLRTPAEIMAWKDRCVVGTEPYLIGYWPLLSWPGTSRRGILSGLVDQCEYAHHHGMRSPHGTNWVRIPLGYLPVKITRIVNPLFFLFGSAHAHRTSLLQMNADNPTDSVQWSGAAWYHEEVRMRRGFEMEATLRFAKMPNNCSYTFMIQGGSKLSSPHYGRSNALPEHGLTPIKNIVALIINFPSTAGAPVKTLINHFDNKQTPTINTINWAEEVPSLTELGVHVSIVYDGAGLTFAVNGHPVRAELDLGTLLSMNGPNPCGWIGMFCNLSTTTWCDTWTFKSTDRAAVNMASQLRRSVADCAAALDAAQDNVALATARLLEEKANATPSPLALPVLPSLAPPMMDLPPTQHDKKSSGDHQYCAINPSLSGHWDSTSLGCVDLRTIGSIRAQRIRATYQTGLHQGGQFRGFLLRSSFLAELPPPSTIPVTGGTPPIGASQTDLTPSFLTASARYAPHMISHEYINGWSMIGSWKANDNKMWKPCRIDFDSTLSSFKGFWSSNDSCGTFLGTRIDMHHQMNLKRGIVNSGNSCYMNAFVQALFMTSPLRHELARIPFQYDYTKAENEWNYAQKDRGTVRQPANPIPSSIPLEGAVATSPSATVQRLQRVFLKLMLSQRAHFPVTAFQECLPEIWRGAFQQDSAEFGSYLLDQIELGLKGVDTEVDMDTLFQGQQQNITQCTKCKRISARMDKFSSLQLDFPNQYTPITGLYLVRGDRTVAPAGFQKIYVDINVNQSRYSSILAAARGKDADAKKLSIKLTMLADDDKSDTSLYLCVSRDASQSPITDIRTVYGDRRRPLMANIPVVHGESDSDRAERIYREYGPQAFMTIPTGYELLPINLNLPKPADEKLLRSPTLTSSGGMTPIRAAAAITASSSGSSSVPLEYELIYLCYSRDEANGFPLTDLNIIPNTTATPKGHDKQQIYPPPAGVMLPPPVVAVVPTKIVQVDTASSAAAGPAGTTSQTSSTTIPPLVSSSSSTTVPPPATAAAATASATGKSDTTLPVAQPVLTPQTTVAAPIGPFISLARCFTGCPIVDIQVVSGSRDVAPPPGYRRTRADAMMSHLGFHSTTGSGDASIFVCYKRGLTAPITKLRVCHSHEEASSLATRGYTTLLLPCVRRPGRPRPMTGSSAPSLPSAPGTPTTGVASLNPPPPAAAAPVAPVMVTQEEDVIYICFRRGSGCPITKLSMHRGDNIPPQFGDHQNMQLYDEPIGDTIGAPDGRWASNSTFTPAVTFKTIQSEIKGAQYVNGRFDMNDGTTRGFVWPSAPGKYMFEGALHHRVWREPAYCMLEFDEQAMRFEGSWYHGDSSGTWTGYKHAHSVIDYDQYSTYRLQSPDKKMVWCSADGRVWCHSDSSHLPDWELITLIPITGEPGAFNLVNRHGKYIAMDHMGNVSAYHPFSPNARVDTIWYYELVDKEQGKYVFRTATGMGLGYNTHNTLLQGRDTPNDAIDFFYGQLVPPVIRDGADRLNGHWVCQLYGPKFQQPPSRLELAIGSHANISRVQGKLGDRNVGDRHTWALPPVPVNGQLPIITDMKERKEETLEGILAKEKDTFVLEGKWNSFKGPKPRPFHIVFDKKWSSFKANFWNGEQKTNLQGKPDNYVCMTSYKNYNERWSKGVRVSSAVATGEHLDSMIKQFFNRQVMDDKNRYRCQGCQGLRRAEQFVRITRAPQHLLVTLKRFSYDARAGVKSKIFKEIDYPVTLTLPVEPLAANDTKAAHSATPSTATTITTPVVPTSATPGDTVGVTTAAPSTVTPVVNEGKSEEKRSDELRHTMLSPTPLSPSILDELPHDDAIPHVYHLYAVLVHSGNSADVGHYYCYARDSDAPDLKDAESKSNPWYRFDDQHVTLASFSELKEVTNRSVQDSAYILFYKLITRPISSTASPAPAAATATASPSTVSATITSDPIASVSAVTPTGSNVTVSLTTVPLQSSPSLGGGITARTRSPLQLEMCPSAPSLVHQDNRAFLTELQSTYSEHYHHHHYRSTLAAIHDHITTTESAATSGHGWTQLIHNRHQSPAMTACYDHTITAPLASMMTDPSSQRHAMRTLRHDLLTFDTMGSEAFMASFASRNRDSVTAAVTARLSAAGHIVTSPSTSVSTPSTSTTPTSVTGKPPAAAATTATAAGSLFVMCPSQCSKKILASKLAHHLQHSCSRTPASCRFCGKYCSAISLKMQYMQPSYNGGSCTCAYRDMLPLACKYCTKRVMLKDHVAHEESCARAFDVWIRAKEQRRIEQLAVEDREQKAKELKDRELKERELKERETKEKSAAANTMIGPQLPSAYTGTGTGGALVEVLVECPFLCGGKFRQSEIESHCDRCPAAG